MTVPHINVVFDPPLEGDDVGTFSAKAFDLGQKLNPFSTQANALIDEVNALALAAAAAAGDISELPAKSTPVDADLLLLGDSAAGNATKKTTAGSLLQVSLSAEAGSRDLPTTARQAIAIKLQALRNNARLLLDQIGSRRATGVAYSNNNELAVADAGSSFWPSGDVTAVWLPNATSLFNGASYTICNPLGHSITVAPQTGQLINGASTFVMPMKTALTFSCAGVDWHVTSPHGISQPEGAAPVFGARAWANFGYSGGSVTVRGSGNVAGISRTSTGIYMVSFTEPMPGADYCVSANVGVTTGIINTRIGSLTASGFELSTYTAGPNLTDTALAMFSVFR